jgi:choline kinase
MFYLTLGAVIAVVLAAGTGSRLRPLTDAAPKCLIDVAGRPLIERLLDSIEAAGLDRAVIVGGHHFALVEARVRARRGSLGIALVRNTRYETTNNAASLAMAREAVGTDGIVVCDADVIFSADPLPALIAHPADCAFAVDTNIRWDAEAMKVQLRADRSVQRISKALDAAESAGESIGVQKIGRASAPLMWTALESLTSTHAATAYYEDAFQQMIDSGVRFGISPVPAFSWMEIDDAADLAAARERFGT